MRGICISENMPSCMRAPPEAVKMMKGVCCSIARNMPATMASPAAMPSEPPRNSKSCTATVTCSPLQGAGRQPHRVGGAGLGAIFLEPVGIALDVAEFQRIGGTSGRRQCFIVAIVEQGVEPRLDRDAHVIAGARHHEEIGLQILVEHQRAAVRTFDPEIFRAFRAA